MSGEGDPVSVLIGRLLGRLPPELVELIELGYKPTFHRATGRWYLQKRIGKKVSRKVVPKEYDDVMARLRSLLDREEGKAIQNMYKQHLKLRETVKRSEKPIIAKEIEDSAWFHNLLHDLGKYAYHRLVRYVDWTPEDVKDYKKAFDKLSDMLDNLMMLIEDAKKLERLVDERDALKFALSMALDQANELLALVRSYQQYVNLLLQYIPDDKKTVLLNSLIISRALEALPEISGGE